MAMNRKPKPLRPDTTGTKAEVRGRLSTKPTIKVVPKSPLKKATVKNPNAPKGGTPPTGNVKVVPPKKKTPPKGSTKRVVVHHVAVHELHQVAVAVCVAAVLVAVEWVSLETLDNKLWTHG